ncbi:hypothetical protein [Aquamicrobium terrae]|uniref:Flagellar protein n=1 Tax=Aquamicrobium terrae TaxID=1324945 RepID=A0ABV2MXY2_9HYPH
MATERQRTEALLQNLLAKARAEEEAEAARASLLSGLFNRPKARQPAPAPIPESWPAPPPTPFPRIDKASRRADRRSDLIIAGLGVALGLICALFPWYIFFNQEQFGVRAMRLGGQGTNSGRVMVDAASAPARVREIPELPGDLDLFSTGNIADSATGTPPGLDEQPFPGAATEFRLVHVANGRAMIEDDAGLWVVQNGSRLPDSSRVAAIEQRAGKWVLVTSKDRVVEISE